MIDPISSPQNEKVKLVRLLQTQAKTRRKERKIVLEGVRLIRDACEQGQTPEFVLYTEANADSALVALLNQRKILLVPVSDTVMRDISETQQPQGIIGVFPLPFPLMPRNPRRVLILDAIREPGNLGTMLRTAGAAGIQVVILSPDCADPYNPKVLRGGMGAHFRIPVVEATWTEIANYCQELTIYLADIHSDRRYSDVDWSVAWALIIGSEAHGAGEDAAQLSAIPIAIPMSAETESLNAAVATGVILFEALRQRMKA